MKKLGTSFTAGAIFILVYIVIEQIDAIHFRPYMRDASLKSQIECHDDPKKCWLIDLKHKGNRK